MKKSSFLLGIISAGLLAGSALAADVAPAPAAFDWSGVYVGAQGGLDMYTANNAGSRKLPDSTGFEGGGNIEFLRQSNNFVFGAIGDFNLSSNNATQSCSGGPVTCSLSSSWNASLRGKLGFATNNVMFYGTGGWGWADFHKTSSNNNSDFRTLNGWVGGVGMAYAINPKWSVNVEYLHYDLGSGSKFVVNGGFGSEVVGPTMDTVTMGVSYKF